MQATRPTIFASNLFGGLNKTAFTREVNRNLEKAERVACEILEKKFDGKNYSDGSAPHLGVVHHYYDPFWYPSYPSIWVRDSGNSCLNSERNKKEERVALGTIFTVVGLATAFFIGKDWKVSSEAQEERQRCGNERARFCRYKEFQEGHPLANQISRIQELEEEIFARIERDAHQGLAMKSMLLSFSACGLAGCIANLPLFMTGGVVGGIVTGGVMLFRAGASSVAKQNEQNAREIIHELKHLPA